MFELIENIKLLIQNRDKVALAVLFIAICHMIPIVIEYFKREKEEKIYKLVYPLFFCYTESQKHKTKLRRYILWTKTQQETF